MCLGIPEAEMIRSPAPKRSSGILACPQLCVGTCRKLSLEIPMFASNRHPEAPTL